MATPRFAQQMNHRILIALLKEHGIRKIIASPGGSNVPFVASVQQDSFFEMYSAVDERSAAYMATGMAEESGEPVVICCTGATASRNYYPGLTEAYYRKLPVLAVTAHLGREYIGNLRQQVLDRSVVANDVVVKSVQLDPVKDKNDEFLCTKLVNEALLALRHHGGGPVHINLALGGWYDFSADTLPQVRKIERVMPDESFPELPSGRIGILMGSHREWTEEETSAIEAFCEKHNAAVLCEHISGYHGKFRVLFPLVSVQPHMEESKHFDLLIHLGEITSEHGMLRCQAKQVWRVSEDGELRDTFRTLSCVFEMSPLLFFRQYANKSVMKNDLYPQLQRQFEELASLPNDQLPFSNCWVARAMGPLLPDNSVIHLGILNSLRVWNYTMLPATVRAYSNVGGFGTDGGLSSFLGASLVHPDKLYYCVIGDLAFFYDMNALGNRHVGRNIRILLVNNGKGGEFHLKGGPYDYFAEETEKFISAAGHNGHQSSSLVRHYAEDLGFEYLTASDKEGFNQVMTRFTSPVMGNSPMLLELFTTAEDERTATDLLRVQGEAQRSSGQRVRAKLKSFFR